MYNLITNNGYLNWFLYLLIVINMYQIRVIYHIFNDKKYIETVIFMYYLSYKNKIKLN